MADNTDVKHLDPTDVFAIGRRHLAVRDYSNAVSTLAQVCEMLAKQHGEQADQCADAYLWYGKALLGLAREESGVLGDKVPQNEDADKDSDEEQEANGEESDSGEAEAVDQDTEKVETEQKTGKAADQDAKKVDAEQKTEEAAASGSGGPASSADAEQPDSLNGEGAGDESAVDLEEDDVDNLQLAWEMLDLARSILEKRVSGGGGDAARALLADVHLSLGEVALESETYDKAVIDMQNCLEIQKGLYSSDDRRIAETHYQIGLANSLSSNFDAAITHFKQAASILETRVKMLENPAAEDAAIKKASAADPNAAAAEIKELKELLPEIQEKIQDMIEYKAETMRKLRDELCKSSNGQSSNGGPSDGQSASGAPKQASDISHLIKRKRKPSTDEDGDTPAKNPKP